MKTKKSYWIILLIIAALLVGAIGAKGGYSMKLWSFWSFLQSREYVDMTHAFEPGIPHWPGFQDETVELLYWYDDNPPGPGTLGTGFYAQNFSHVGQWGTHVDPPAHFIRGLRTVDQIEVKEMVLPLEKTRDIIRIR